MGEQFVLTESEGGDSGADKAWTPIPDNTFFDAEVLSVATVKKPYKSKDDGSDVYRVEWEFQITGEGEYKSRKIKGETSKAFVKHPDCKLFMWVQSTFGKELPSGFQFNTETLVGVACRIHVECKQGGEKRDKPGEYWINNRVKDVLSASKVPVGSAYAEEESF